MHGNGQRRAWPNDLGLAGKQRRGMTIRPDAKQDQIKARQLSAKRGGERFFIRARRSLGRAADGRDRVDIRGWDGNMRQQRFARHAVAALDIVRRHHALIAPKDVDIGPIDRFAQRRLRQALVQRARRAAARKRHREAPVIGDRRLRQRHKAPCGLSRPAPQDREE